MSGGTGYAIHTVLSNRGFFAPSGLSGTEFGGSLSAGATPHAVSAPPFTFTDASWVGASGPTKGVFEVQASWPGNNPTLTITRLIYDDADPTGASLPTFATLQASPYPEATMVPEPSGLALLALGAGGLLQRRRRALRSRQGS